MCYPHDFFFFWGYYHLVARLCSLIFTCDSWLKQISFTSWEINNLDVVYIIIIFYLSHNFVLICTGGVFILLLTFDQDIIFFVMEASYISTSSSHCEHFITPSLHYVGMSVLKSLPRTIWMLDMNSLFRGLGYRAKQLLFFFFFSPRVKFSYVEPNGKMNLNQSWIHSGLQTEVTRGHFWSSKVALIIHPWH